MLLKGIGDRAVHHGAVLLLFRPALLAVHVCVALSDISQENGKANLPTDRERKD
jgi:hypothetical protein